MHKLTLPVLGIIASVVITLPATAQQVDNTLMPLDARPGECYAKVITPPLFETTTEEVVIQEASERIEVVEAEYEPVERNIVAKEGHEALIAVDAVFVSEQDRIETKSAELNWVSKTDRSEVPASPETLAQLTASGIDVQTVAAGSCFTEYYIEAQYETLTEEVLVREASERITIEPPQFETVLERIEVKEASTDVVDVPAVYRTESESVLVEPARTAWQNCGLVERADQTASEVMCLVEIPARYETLTKTVLDKPATTRVVSIPAEYRTVEVERLTQPARETREAIPAEYQIVSKQVKVSEPQFFWLAKGAEPQQGAVPTGRDVCLELAPAEFVSIDRTIVAAPAKVESTPVPSAYTTVEVLQLVSPATERRITIPARTRTVTSRVERAPARYEWRQVLCDVDMTPEIIITLQRALQREGFNPGPLDGIVGRATLNAIEMYQSEHGLGRGGITYEVLEKLEVLNS